MVFVECLLQRGEGAVTRQSLDRRNRRPISLGGEHQAAPHGLAVDLDRAGATHTVRATDVGSGQMEMVADEVDQQQSSLDLALVGPPIDSDVDRDAIRAHGGFYYRQRPKPARLLQRITHFVMDVDAVPEHVLHTGAFAGPVNRQFLLLTGIAMLG